MAFLGGQILLIQPLQAQGSGREINAAAPAIINYTRLADNAMRFLDLTGAQTGILCDRMIAWEGALPAPATGQNVAGGMAGFAQMWWQLYRSALYFHPVGTMFPPERLTGRIMRHTQPAVVPVGIIHYDYNMLDPAALDRGTLTWDAAATALRHNPAVPGPIFLTRTVAYPSVLSPAVRRNQPFALKFTRELFFHNNPANALTTVEVYAIGYTSGNPTPNVHRVLFPVSALASGDFLAQFPNLGELRAIGICLYFANGTWSLFTSQAGLLYID